MGVQAPLKARIAVAVATVLTAALTVTGAATLTAGPAAGGPTTWARTGPGVLYEGCPKHPWRYAVSDEQALYDWAMFVTVYDPRGVEAASGSVWADEGAPASGTATGDDALQLCDSALAGEYTFTAEIHFYGGPFEDQTLAPSTFVMRDPRSRTRLSVSDTTASYNQVIKFKMTSLQEYPKGYFGEDYETVVLQRRTPAGWKRVGGYTTNERGVATTRFRWNERAVVKVRAVTPRTTEHSKSISPTVTIR